MILAWFRAICLMIGLVFGTNVYEFALSMGLVEFAAYGLGVAGFMVGTCALPGILILGNEAHQRKRYPMSVSGIQPWYKATESEIDECLNCGVEDVEGYEIEWGRYRVVLGVAWKQLDGGTHQDCVPCHEDPIEAALRRNNPSRVHAPEEPKNRATLGDPSLAHMNRSGQEKSA